MNVGLHGTGEDSRSLKALAIKRGQAPAEETRRVRKRMSREPALCAPSPAPWALRAEHSWGEASASLSEVLLVPGSEQALGVAVGGGLHQGCLATATRKTSDRRARDGLQGILEDGIVGIGTAIGVGLIGAASS